MPLYKIISEENKLLKIDRNEFANENELHNLIKNNLDNILGIRLIASEYPIPNGRIDTLGLDEDGIPVIIEYKWKKDSSAIIQGLFYLDWIMQNRRPFESIVADKLGKDIEVNWSTQPRLIIIAQDFDIKELSAINQMSPRIELIKYSLYSGLFNIEGVNIVESKTSSRGAIKPAEEIEESKEIAVEELLSRTNDDTQKLFLVLREKILGLSESIWEKLHSGYVDYRTISTFASIHMRKSSLKIFIKMGDRHLLDPENKCYPIPAKWGYGNLNTQFDIDEESEIEYAMDLINQAYEYVTG